ncbi:hypothetical protein PVAP13_2NG274000 [Panicum virgatum]|uniref:Uncharacterized protein n=1 Tax=Panicum virgatum TaxID=38727 RepID=A0A8T0VFL3_PANVG|nr:hypothetical protein PVAP13_2NG274000 [Panicum virgatum]
MADELCVPAVAPPLVWQIKCLQLFSGGDGGASGVGSGVAAAWSFCFLGFASDSPEAIFRADGGGAAFNSDVFYISGGQVKLLVLCGDSGEVLSVVRPVRFVSVFFVKGRQQVSPAVGFPSWLLLLAAAADPSSGRRHRWWRIQWQFGSRWCGVAGIQEDGNFWVCGLDYLVIQGVSCKFAGLYCTSD